MNENINLMPLDTREGECFCAYQAKSERCTYEIIELFSHHNSIKLFFQDENLVIIDGCLLGRPPKTNTDFHPMSMRHSISGKTKLLSDADICLLLHSNTDNRQRYLQTLSSEFNINSENLWERICALKSEFIFWKKQRSVNQDKTAEIAGMSDINAN